jgi:hypothetical protein
MGMELRTEDVDGAVWIVKSASSPEETARLDHEASQLRRAAHPGVIEIGSLDAVAGSDAGGRTELRSRYAGRSLRATGAIPAPALCGLGAAVATVLADLHDLGLVHGAVDADHILLGEDGRPVLCGFGSSGSTDDQDPLGDVCSLAATLAGHLQPDAPRRLVRVLRSAAPGGRRVPSARAFAGLLRRADPDCRLPAAIPPRPRPVDPLDLAPSTPVAAGDRADIPDAAAPTPAAPTPAAPTPAAPTPAAPTPAAPTPAAPTPAGDGRDATVRVGAPAGSALPAPAGTKVRRPIRSGSRSRSRSHSWSRPGPPPRRPRLIAGGVVIVALVVVVTLVGSWTRHRPVTARPEAARAVACPTTDRGCGPIVLRDGTFAAPSGTFAVGVRDAVVVLGRWTCGPGSLPAALDPRTGQVWAWLIWALPTDTVRAVAVTTRVGARDLRVLPGASGCDRLQVVDADGTVAVVAPGSGRRA